MFDGVEGKRIKSVSEQVKQGRSEPCAPGAEVMLRALMSDRAEIAAFVESLRFQHFIQLSLIRCHLMIDTYGPKIEI